MVPWRWGEGEHLNTIGCMSLPVCSCVFGVLALPLCGAAVTFFAAAKKVTKESSRSARWARRWPHVTRRKWNSLSVSRSRWKGFWRVLGCPHAHSSILVRLRFVPASRCALGRRGVQGQARTQQLIGVGKRWHSHAGRLRFATSSDMPCVGTQCKTDE